MMQRVPRSGRELLPPETVDERVDRHDPAVPEREHRQQGLTLRAAHVRRPSRPTRTSNGPRSRISSGSCIAAAPPRTSLSHLPPREGRARAAWQPAASLALAWQRPGARSRHEPDRRRRARDEPAPRPDESAKTGRPTRGRRSAGARSAPSCCSWRSTGRSSLLFYGAAARQRVTIPYSPHLPRQVQAGNVATVTARERRSRGRSSTRSATRPARQERQSRRPSSRRGCRTSPTRRRSTRCCRQNGVVVTAKAPPGTPWWETLLAGFGPTLLFFGLWYLAHAAVGQRRHVLLRKLEGEEVRADDGAGHLRRRRRDRRGEGGADRGRRLPPRPGEVPQARRAHPARRPADRRAGHGQDAARARGRRRGGRPVLLHVRVRVRRDDRRRRRLPRPRPLRPGEGSRAVDHLHRRDRRDRPLARAPAPTAAPTTSASRRSTRS